MIAAIARRGRRILARLRRDRRGALLPEFALAMPILVLLSLGGIEVSRYILLHQKLDRVVATLGDLTAQAESLTVAEMDNLFEAVGYVIKPFEMAANGTVIVTAISASGGGSARVDWQRSGGGSYPATSSFGAPGGSATLPSGFVVRDGESLVVAEIFYSYAPWVVGGITEAKELYARALFRPRFGAIASLN
ncbi:MAG: TadE/TadG family type IV pilus assembly protein [Alphaproteobacteria bacterium]